MISIPVYNTEGKEVEKVNLDADIFDGEVKSGVLHQVILMYQANKRKGLASTQTRGEVSGGGRKPWKQKGTGRARAGSIRSPIWKGGGVVFGPKPRDYTYHLPKKLKKVALRYSLNDKINNKKLIVVDEIKIDKPKTKLFASILDNLKVNGKTLLMLDKANSDILRSSRNISQISVKQVSNSNAYDVLKNQALIITKAGLKVLTERIKGENKTKSSPSTNSGFLKESRAKSREE